MPPGGQRVPVIAVGHGRTVASVNVTKVPYGAVIGRDGDDPSRRPDHRDWDPHTASDRFGSGRRDLRLSTLSTASAVIEQTDELTGLASVEDRSEASVGGQRTCVRWCGLVDKKGETCAAR